MRPGYSDQHFRWLIIQKEKQMSTEINDDMIEIIAISGDLAAGGLADTAAEMTVSFEDWSNIEFLQALQDVRHFLSGESQPLDEIMSDHIHDLITSKLSKAFPSKWHFRTTWANKESIVRAVDSAPRTEQ